MLLPILVAVCLRNGMAPSGVLIPMGLATLIGEELDMDPALFALNFAGPHADYNNPDMGVQGTGGSNSLKAHYYQLRQVGADTRQLLLNAAAQDLSVSKDSLSTDNGHIVSGDERHPYGQFIATAASLNMPEDTPLKANSAFQYIGKEKVCYIPIFQHGYK